jgi:beta-carotene/zeaxanthin 4-ketolase
MVSPIAEGTSLSSFPEAFPSELSILRQRTHWLGLAIALLILSVWLASTVVLLRCNISQWHPLGRYLATAWQTFLYTGLFITAHDAIHGVVVPQRARINRMIGAIALLAYAMFPYPQIAQRHWLHHQHPASTLDPDFHNGTHKHWLLWYLYFMFRYWSWLRFIALATAYNLMFRLLHIPEANLVAFWVIPPLLSSLQLFYFGTYLPHRQPVGGYTHPSRAETIRRTWFWSFVTCYHFGYHREHHDYPLVPWWLLPQVGRLG